MKEFYIYERKNHNALHAICESESRANRWLKNNAYEYCSRGFFTDKSLTPQSFEYVIKNFSINNQDLELYTYLSPKGNNIYGIRRKGQIGGGMFEGLCKFAAIEFAQKRFS